MEMKPNQTVPTRKAPLARAWNMITYLGFLVFFFGIILVPAYMGGWRFGTWFREVIVIIWPLGGVSSLLAVLAAHQYRKQGDPDQAFRWMFGAAIAALLSLFMLWLTVRDRL